MAKVTHRSRRQLIVEFEFKSQLRQAISSLITAGVVFKVYPQSRRLEVHAADSDHLEQWLTPA